MYCHSGVDTDIVFRFDIAVCLVDFNCTAVPAADNSVRVRCGWDDDYEWAVPLTDINCQVAVIRI
jgi:hypothetical protein